MNNAPITVILIGALGLVAVITLGAFFAVKVKTRTSYLVDRQAMARFNYSDNVVTKAVDYGTRTPKTTPAYTTTTLKSTTSTTATAGSTTQGSTVAVFSAAPKKAKTTTTTSTSTVDTTSTTSTKTETIAVNTYTDPSETPARTDDTTSAGTTSTPIASNKSTESVSTNTADSSSTRTNTGSRATAEITHSDSASTNTETVRTEISRAPNTETANSEPEWYSEVSLAHYGRVVGLAYSEKKLFAGSIRNGNISIMTTPDLKVVEEITCSGCHIYDIVVVRNGDIVVAQGKHQKLTKISRRTGRVVRELDLSYATKGVAISKRGEIFVLTRSHDKIYRYNSLLDPTGTIHLPNEANDDCNFLTVDRENRLLISCENSLFVVGSRGELIQVIKPPRGASYSVGITSDKNGRILVVRRGKTAIDIFDSRGAFQRTIGREKEVLWSDMALGRDHLFLLDYIGASIKSMRYA